MCQRKATAVGLSGMFRGSLSPLAADSHAHSRAARCPGQSCYNPAVMARVGETSTSSDTARAVARAAPLCIVAYGALLLLLGRLRVPTVSLAVALSIVGSVVL